MASRILVTGGAGFIGSAVVPPPDRATRRTTVVNLDKLTYAGQPRSRSAPIAGNPRYAFEQADICDRAGAATRSSQRIRPDAVMHLAAESHVDRSIDGPRDFIETNVVGTFTLLEAARGYWRTLTRRGATRFRFHHVSTDEVYGSLGADGHVHRGHALRPELALFGLARRRPTIWCAPGTTPTACRWCVTNCSNNYGPYHFPEKLIPLMILNALRRQAAAGLRRRRERPRLALRRGPRRRAAARAARRAGRARPTTSAARNERTQHRGRRDDLRPARRAAPDADRLARDADHLRHRPARPRPALCHRRHARSRRELGWRAARRPSRPGSTRPCAGISTTRDWWQPLRERRLWRRAARPRETA